MRGLPVSHMLPCPEIMTQPPDCAAFGELLVESPPSCILSSLLFASALF
ncbi:hypothetical protein E2C01_083333 [Portunus trituberculatus]|uniref:Uncharacterized protein n=1 Tax=Portunus trituberculatus TaxID=210409 RepID=A0A5B7IS62_PORTR|nr:hypothetical protein [Portunus trituberculatus]